MITAEERIKELIYCKKKLEHHCVGFDIQEISGKSRISDLVFKRALIVFILRDKGLKLDEIAQILNRTHGAIVNLLKYSTKKEGRDSRYSPIISKLS